MTRPLAEAEGGEERVARQHASDRRTLRERIERLFDPGTFHETGALVGVGAYDEDGELTDFTPANMVCGQGEIEGRAAVVQGDDFTVRGGAADAAIWQKMVFAERLAHDLRLPLVRLVDGEAKPVTRPLAEAVGAAARSSRSSRWATPTCPSSPAWSWRSPTSRACRWRPPRSGRWPGSAPRASSPRTSA